MAFGKLPGSPELDAMSLRDVRTTYAVWERSPPPHRALAMLLGAQTTWKPKDKPLPEGRFRQSSVDELLAFAGAAGMRIQTRK